MALKDDVKILFDCYEKKRSTLSHNHALFNIIEGCLLQYVLDDLRNQLSDKAYNQIIHRVPPINVLIRIMDKLSKIYKEPPVRRAIDGSEQDQDQLDILIKELDMNTVMSEANLFFNLFKNTAVEPYLYLGKPYLRTIPSDRFFVYSNDPVNPLIPTHFVKIMGKMYVSDNDERMIFYAYTDDEFIIFDDKKEIRNEMMLALDNQEGVNIYGKIPFTYINKSLHNIMPPPDTDTLCMTKLMPILLADANFASMFQSFSVVYGIDVDDEDIQMSPNSFWRFKSDPNRETKPEIGVIKPEADTDKVLNLVLSQLSLWMETRNIKPGGVGSLTTENASSGIAKMIDESDTSEDREKQIPYFIRAEKSLLDLIVNYMHPVWMTEPEYSLKFTFSPNLKFDVTFPKQMPLIDPQRVLDAEILKLDKGLTTKKRALKNIDPNLSEEQIEEILEEINEEVDGDETSEDRDIDTEPILEDRA